MKKRSGVCFSAILAGFAIASVGWGQSNWVDFTDDRNRMQFNTDDNEEKDIDVGDLDNDGDDDILVVRKMPFSVPGARANILLMNENGRLVDRTSTYMPTFASDPDDSRDVRIFDANNDGWLDAVTVTTFSDPPRLYINLGTDGSGNWLGFEDKANWYSPEFPVGPKFCGLGIGDVNADGFDDLLFVDYSNNLENRLLINNQDDTFTDETEARMSSEVASTGFGTQGAILDFNYDGSEDLIVLQAALIEFIRNDGTGHFLNNNQIQVLATTSVYMFAVADFNNDDRADIYIVDDGQDYIIFNNSTNANGTVNTTVQYLVNSVRTSGFNGNVHPADADVDGWMDMAVCDVDVDIPGCSRRFALVRNNGTTLTDPNNTLVLPWNVNGSHDMCWLDINCDGRQDMFIATCNNYYMFVQDYELVLGDVNRDGEVNLLDVGPFIDVISSGTCHAQADTNQDGQNNLLDVASFVALLDGG